MRKIVEAKKIKKVYGSKGNVFPVLHGIDFIVEENEFVGIMGPSGSGKTTLLNIIATIDQPTSGDIIIDGENILKFDEEQLSNFRRRKLGFIFQDYNLLDTLTVKENIILPLTITNLNVSEMENQLHEVVEKFGIGDILEKYPYQISGGQKQRTAACRAIITNPSLILADEPTGALDSRSATDLLESLKAINENDKATIFMVTHDAFAASYCKRVLFIKDGNIFTEIIKGNIPRKDFYKKILDVLAVLGGSSNDII